MLAALRRLRMTRPRSPRCSRCRSRPSVRDLDPDRPRAGSRVCGRSSRPTATSASVRASSSTSTSRSWDGSTVPATASPATGAARPAPATRALDRLGVRARLRRRRDPARLRRGARRREGNDRDRLPPPRSRALPPPSASASSACSPTTAPPTAPRPRARLPHARDQAPPHPPLPARTNGKAERFIRTLLGGWAYGAIYGKARERRAPSPAGSTSTTAPTTRLTRPQATRHPAPEAAPAGAPHKPLIAREAR